MYLLKDFGSFYVGGRTIQLNNQPIQRIKRNESLTMDVDPNGDYTIESIYVQYFLPQDYQKTCVLIHGGGHTGAIWETTPDGRKGFLHFLLEQNIAVYVVDTVERGRSGWCSIPGIWEGEPELRSHQTTWKDFRLGVAANIPHENLQFPIEYLSSVVKYNVPRWNCNNNSSALALSQLVNKIGECFFIAHSQGAAVAMACLNLQPKLIQSILLLEPAAFPALDPQISWQGKNVSIVFGDYIDYSPLWVSLQQQAITYQKMLSRRGIRGEYISLPEKNIFGNSHLLMMEKNNAEIFKFLFRHGESNLIL